MDKSNASLALSSALQALRLALVDLDAGDLARGVPRVRDAQRDVYLAYKALGGYGHPDELAQDVARDATSKILGYVVVDKAGEPAECESCGKVVTGPAWLAMFTYGGGEVCPIGPCCETCAHE